MVKIGGHKGKRSSMGTLSAIATLGIGLGAASFALRRNQGSQMKNMLPIPMPENNEDTKS